MASIQARERTGSRFNVLASDEQGEEGDTAVEEDAFQFGEQNKEIGGNSHAKLMGFDKKQHEARIDKGKAKVGGLKVGLKAMSKKPGSQGNKGIKLGITRIGSGMDKDFKDHGVFNGFGDSNLGLLNG